MPASQKASTVPGRVLPPPAAADAIPPGLRCTLSAMDLDLAPEHLLLRDTVREFMLAEVGPLGELESHGFQCGKERGEARHHALFERTMIEQCGDLAKG